MEIPNLQKAVVEDLKIKEYLLNLNHPDGRGKAIFFLQKGFDNANIPEFREMLIYHASENPIAKIQTTEWGTKYIVTGTVKWKQLNAFNLTTVWIIERGLDFPKLATAYPA